ncbi:MAG: universal stress protein [Flavobacteriales bacterium]|nr:universal stress protein [Flavobacteriales bacterium]
MKNILLGIDFHEKTPHLIEEAVKLVKPLGAKLWLLHVAEPNPDFVGFEVGPQVVRDHRAQELRTEHRMLDDYANLIKEQGVDSEGLLIPGPTIETILDEVKRLNIDLVITGHHRHSLLSEALFGTHSSKLIDASPVPVLVIPCIKEED